MLAKGNRQEDPRSPAGQIPAVNLDNSPNVTDDQTLKCLFQSKIGKKTLIVAMELETSERIVTKETKQPN